MRTTEEKLMEQFEPAVKQISIREDFRDELLVALTQTQDKTRKAMKRELEGYEDALKALESREDDVYEDFKAGALDDAGHRRQLQKVRDERSRFTGLS
jgi:hypothetical protein